MRLSDIEPDLIGRLISEKLRQHPLPWRIEVDWTCEVTDANGRIVLKCVNHTEASELISRASAIHMENTLLAKEVEALLDVASEDPKEPDWWGKCKCWRPGWLEGHDDSKCEFRENKETVKCAAYGCRLRDGHDGLHQDHAGLTFGIK